MKIKPMFELDGDKYEFICTRYLQDEWDKMTAEKQNDAAFQLKSANASHAQQEFEAITQKYTFAREDYYSDPLDEEKEKIYLKLKSLYETAYKEYSEFLANGNFESEAQKYTLDCCEKLVILALEEQYHLPHAEATRTWERYVEENGKLNASEWLAYFATAFFGTLDDEADENPFIAKMRQREAVAAQHRRMGLRNK